MSKQKHPPVKSPEETRGRPPMPLGKARLKRKEVSFNDAEWELLVKVAGERPIAEFIRDAAIEKALRRKAGL